MNKKNAGLLTKLPILTLAAAALALAGCGSSSSSGNGVAAKSAAEILTAAQAAAGKASSVHVKGTASSESQKVSLDLEIVSGKGAQGTITEHGFTLKLVDVGGYVYIYGTPQFYSQFGGEAAAKLFNGKWLQAPSNSSGFSSLGNLTDLHKLLNTEVETHSAKLAKGSTATVGGTSAIALEDTQRGGILYVATSGEPYPVKVEKKGSEGGSITFSDWNGSVSLKAPSDAINITQLQHAG